MAIPLITDSGADYFSPSPQLLRTPPQYAGGVLDESYPAETFRSPIPQNTTIFHHEEEGGYTPPPYTGAVPVEPPDFQPRGPIDDIQVPIAPINADNYFARTRTLPPTLPPVGDTPGGPIAGEIVPGLQTTVAGLSQTGILILLAAFAAWYYFGE